MRRWTDNSTFGLLARKNKKQLFLLVAGGVAIMENMPARCVSARSLIGSWDLGRI